MAIAFYAEDTKLPAIKKRAVGNWVKEVAATYGKKVGDISYIFCSDEKILEVNRQYLQHDYYTDIITFDYTSGDKISGDLFISLDTVKTNSEAFNTPYNEELHRTIIHGILNLFSSILNRKRLQTFLFTGKVDFPGIPPAISPGLCFRWPP